MRLVVIGGGISGLAAAHAARWAGEEIPGGLEVLVLEREPEVGGKARSLEEQGYLVEAGPTGYLDNEPLLDRLVDLAGLEKLPANVAAARRFLVRGGRLREIKTHPLGFLASGLLGPWGLLRLGAELAVPRKRDGRDESIFEFARRRLGRQAAERMIAPMVLGVFAGDAARLSVAASFPRMVELERDHGGLIRAMLALRRRARAERSAEDSGARGGPAGPAGALTSFTGGLQSLPRALATHPGIEVRAGASVERLLLREDGGYDLLLAGGNEPLRADAVILAGEPWSMAPLIEGPCPAAAAELTAIETPPVLVVALGFAPAMRGAVPKGFGALIPRGEGFRILGCLWDTHLFPGREPGGHLLVRAMLGGAVDPEVIRLSDEQVLTQTLADLRALMPLHDEPLYAKVIRWPRAIPQYTIGHLERVARLREALARRPGLLLAGNATDGIAFTKAAAAGVAAGEAASRWLRERSAPVIP